VNVSVMYGHKVVNPRMTVRLVVADTVEDDASESTDWYERLVTTAQWALAGGVLVGGVWLLDALLSRPFVTGRYF
jgi:hypothetical protein